MLHTRPSTRLCKAFFSMKRKTVVSFYFTAITSISTNAPLGNSFTATADRAGNEPLNCEAYTSFIGTKSETYRPKRRPSSLHHRTYIRLRQGLPSNWQKPESVLYHDYLLLQIAIVAGPIGICPEVKSIFPTCMA